MRALSVVLQDLLLAAEYIVARPLAGTMAADRAARLKDIAAEVRYHDDLPAEAKRTTRGGVALAHAIESYWRSEGDQLAPLWLGCVGLLLPIVRIEAEQALRNDREALRS